MTKYQVVFGADNSPHVIKDRESRVVFSSDSKVMVIAKAQELNGFFVNGNEQAYAVQVQRENRNA